MAQDSNSGEKGGLDLKKYLKGSHLGFTLSVFSIKRNVMTREKKIPLHIYTGPRPCQALPHPLDLGCLISIQ